MLEWIENNSTLVEIVLKTVSWSIGIVAAGVLFYFNTYKKKKSAALFGFYTQYDFLLSILEEQIKNCAENNNPYTLLYTKDARIELGILLPGGGEQQTIEIFKPVTTQLKELLLNSENNVYPRIIKKKEWYSNNLIIINFALMITDKINNNSIHCDSENAKTIYKNKWQDLTKAISDLRKEIRAIQY